MRYKCKVSYDGTLFHGFQKQNGLRTVEEELTSTLKEVFHNDIKIYASGRTDAGVHAKGQVFHFDNDLEIKPLSLKKAINSLLTKDIYINNIEVVDENFHARFSAHRKEYHYLADLGEFDPLKRNYRCYYFYKNIDLDKVVECSKILLGTHDFTSFSKKKELDNPIRTIFDIEITQDGTLITFKFIGDGFFHNQVRIMVAMLLEVGRGEITIDNFKDILESKNRRRAPKVMPPEGLYLSKVYY